MAFSEWPLISQKSTPSPSPIMGDRGQGCRRRIPRPKFYNISANELKTLEIYYEDE